MLSCTSWTWGRCRSRRVSPGTSSSSSTSRRRIFQTGRSWIFEPHASLFSTFLPQCRTRCGCQPVLYSRLLSHRGISLSDSIRKLLMSEATEGTTYRKTRCQWLWNRPCRCSLVAGASPARSSRSLLPWSLWLKCSHCQISDKYWALIG